MQLHGNVMKMLKKKKKKNAFHYPQPDFQLLNRIGMEISYADLYVDITKKKKKKNERIFPVCSVKLTAIDR